MRTENGIKKAARRVLLFIIAAILFRWAGGDSLQYEIDKSPMPVLNNVLPEITPGVTVEQEFSVSADAIKELELTVSCYGRTTNNGLLELELIDAGTGAILAETGFDVSQITVDQIITWNLQEPVFEVRDKLLKLRITSDCAPGYGMSIYFLQDELERECHLLLNGEVIGGILCVSVTDYSKYWFGEYYWYIAAGILALAILYSIWARGCQRHGKQPLATRLGLIWQRYKFLVKQLVGRDFKTKYKRSILGYFWSLLNPLLSMLVQYIVFSTIFKQDIENFPVYLLSGIVFFNFFVDAVSQGLNAILCNSSLITKVYVPKYIYPVTKVLSCSINLFISIIPLFVVMVLTKEAFTRALLLMAFPLAWVLLFSMGLAMALSSAMVFFRDTQYLWGVFSLAWTYATPLFYPARIIPEEFQFILRINPMNHYITFLRELLIAGQSPELSSYISCTFSAVLMLLIGAVIFKKSQDKFILYI